MSLDFELHWGTRDHLQRGDPDFKDLAASRQVVHATAYVFARRKIRATWATVGFLFASTQRELSTYIPKERPRYQRPEFNPYSEPVGSDEESEPEHLAGFARRPAGIDRRPGDSVPHPLPLLTAWNSGSPKHHSELTLRPLRESLLTGISNSPASSSRATNGTRTTRTPSERADSTVFEARNPGLATKLGATRNTDL